MPVKLKASDISKNGWQDLRPSDLKGSNVGKALEAWKPYYAKGVNKVFSEGKMDEALGKGVEVTKALGNARKKANAIKKADQKKSANEIVDAYEAEVATFNDGLLSLRENAHKQREAFRKQLKFANALTDKDVITAFILYADKKEFSKNEAMGAVMWRTGKRKEATLKFAASNEWNQDDVVNQALLGHYQGTAPLSASALKQNEDSVANGFFQMVEDDTSQSLFGRFKKKALDEVLAKKFPDGS